MFVILNSLESLPPSFNSIFVIALSPELRITKLPTIVPAFVFSLIEPLKSLKVGTVSVALVILIITV